MPVTRAFRARSINIDMPYDRSKDPYAGLTPTRSSPARRAVLISPEDDTDLAVYPKSVWANEAGYVNCVPVTNDDDEEPVLIYVNAGQALPVAVRQIWTTGTTVMTLTALFD